MDGIKKRKKLFQRSRGRCWYCGNALDLTTFVADHVIPKSAGGSDGLNNRVAACRPCDKAKGFNTLDEFRALQGVDQFYGERLAQVMGHAAIVSLSELWYRPSQTNEPARPSQQVKRLRLRAQE